MIDDEISHMDALRDFILDGNQEVEDFSGIGGFEDYVDFDGAEDERLTPEEIDDIDFSELRGGVKTSLKKANTKVNQKKKKRPMVRTKGGLKRRVPRKKKKRIEAKVLVSDDRKIIIEGVDKFMMSNDNDSEKKIGWYKGEKLKQLAFTIDNTDGVEFEVDLFRPSERTSYLIANSQDLNDKIIVGAGTTVSYQDIVMNMLSNPAMLLHVQMTFAGQNVSGQLNQPLRFMSSNIASEQVVKPVATQLFFDIQQFQNNTVRFSLIDRLQRGYVPDGLDWIRYKVLAGTSVNMVFFYKQQHLKDFFFKETRNNSVSRFLNKVDN
jgi:hypothetical protein